MNRLKLERLLAGMTQEQLAEKSGICRQTIAALEKDDNKLTTTKTMAAIAAALGKDIPSIFFNDVAK